MRGIVPAALALVAACSFDPAVSPGGGSPGDGDDTDTSADASATDPDATAADGAPAVWTVVETLVIDTGNPDPTYSQTSLDDGVVYRLRVSGTIINVIDSFQGDADWYDFSNPKDNGCCEDIGLGINDFVVNDHDTKPDWGPYDPSHVYEAEWTGEGAPIAALFQDTYYGNNIGDLTLEILALQ